MCHNTRQVEDSCAYVTGKYTIMYSSKNDCVHNVAAMKFPDDYSIRR